MWFLRPVTDTKGVSITEVDGPEEWTIRGTGEAIFTVKNSEGVTRSIIHIGPDGRASVTRLSKKGRAR